MVSKRSTFIYGKKLIKQLPVVTATFTSTTKHDGLSHAVLTRYKLKKHSDYHYITPVIQPIINDDLDVSSKEKTNLLTVLSQNRINTELKKLRKIDWILLQKFFDNNPNIQWDLVGCSNIEKAYEIVWGNLGRNYHNRFNYGWFL